MKEQSIQLGTVTLSSGSALEVEVAYMTYGALNQDGTNAILVTHGYTSNHYMLNHGYGVAEGQWGALIGPGKPLDTDKYFVVCSNMLGSCYGTTGPASTCPRTGKPYRSAFPTITFEDIVKVQRLLLGEIGVNHLRLVIGPSFGGMQALQWALSEPAFVDAMGVILSAPYFPECELKYARLLDVLSADTAWNNGDYSDNAALKRTLTELRFETLLEYGHAERYRQLGLQPSQYLDKIREDASKWASEFDANSLVVLLKAACAFDVRGKMASIRAKTLYVVASTDKLFPPDPSVQECFNQISNIQRPVYIEMDTQLGHTASGPDHRLWSQAIRSLLDSDAVAVSTEKAP